MITIGSAIPSSITQYNSPKSAVNAFNGGILLKHIVENSDFSYCRTFEVE